MIDDRDNGANGDRPAQTLKMVIEYDGTEYSGWQTQEGKTGGPTIQDVLERMLSRVAAERVRVLCSGRTDAGVHALGQVCSVKGSFRYDNERLIHSLNSMLPRDIAIKSIETVDDSFHPIKDAKWKRYRYRLTTSKIPSPHLARTCWWMPVEIDIERMRRAATYIIGKQDFSSFRASGSCAKTSVRNILSLDIDTTEDGLVVFEIVGEGFLKYMVRIIVGTLFEVGRGRFEVDDMKKIIDARDRREAGPTAPARGLFMVEVGY